MNLTSVLNKDLSDLRLKPLIISFNSSIFNLSLFNSISFSEFYIIKNIYTSNRYLTHFSSRNFGK